MDEIVIETRELGLDWYEGSKGYDPGFLGRRVNLPTLSARLRRDLVPLKDGSGYELKYSHFSLLMSKSRRLAFLTAVNIDGKNLQNLKRDRDVWYFDPRIDKEFQTGPEIYKHPDIDRGHLVRRLDPVWGADAKAANEDTFHFTNCSPQHSKLNQRTWLSLEDYVLSNAKVNDLRVTVFTGPIFRPDDFVYLGKYAIPAEFYKVVVIVKTDGAISATAYLQSPARFDRCRHCSQPKGVHLRRIPDVPGPGCAGRTTNVDPVLVGCIRTTLSGKSSARTPRRLRSQSWIPRTLSCRQGRIVFAAVRPRCVRQGAMQAFLSTETLVIELLLVVSLVAIAVRRLRIPYTVALVIVGLLLTTQQSLDLTPTPELILALLVPPLVFEAAFHINVRDLRRNLPGILLLTIPGVVITTAIVGGLVSWLTPLSQSLAFVFGALISATDPVAVVALFRALHAPRRLALLVESESLFNDGTAIVVYNLVVVAAVTGVFHPLAGVLDFLRVAWAASRSV